MRSKSAPVQWPGGPCGSGCWMNLASKKLFGLVVQNASRIESRRDRFHRTYLIVGNFSLVHDRKLWP